MKQSRTTMENDLNFIAKMLHEAVVNQKHTENFHVCEANEVAKKYIKKEG